MKTNGIPIYQDSKTLTALKQPTTFSQEVDLGALRAIQIILTVSLSITGTAPASAGTVPVSSAISRVTFGKSLFSGSALGLASFISVLRNKGEASKASLLPNDPAVAEVATTYSGTYILDVGETGKVNFSLQSNVLNTIYSALTPTAIGMSVSLIAIVTSEPGIMYKVTATNTTSPTLSSEKTADVWIASDTDLSVLITSMKPVNYTSGEIIAAENYNALSFSGSSKPLVDPTTGDDCYVMEIAEGAYAIQTNGSAYVVVTFE